MASSLFSTITGKVFISKHRKGIKDKSVKAEKILNKLHLYFEKSRADNLITLEEMENFEKIYNEIYFAKPAKSQRKSVKTQSETLKLKQEIVKIVEEKLTEVKK